jgi:16S rRNA (uracil1498-N3)-methyltransferase
LAVAHLVVGDLSSPSITLETEDAHHLGSVLRLRVGEKVGATDGAGGYRLYRWSGRGVLEAEAEASWTPRPVPLLTVGFAPVKGERPDWAVQKLAEVGVDRIAILQTARSVVRWSAPQVERMRRVARQAIMQSRGLWLPSIDGPLTFDAAVAEPDAVLASPGGPPPSAGLTSVLVGPEGGWSPNELSVAGATVGLGPSILRTETAAVAAGVLMSALRSGAVRPSVQSP